MSNLYYILLFSLSLSTCLQSSEFEDYFAKPLTEIEAREFIDYCNNLKAQSFQEYETPLNNHINKINRRTFFSYEHLTEFRKHAPSLLAALPNNAWILDSAKEMAMYAGSLARPYANKLIGPPCTLGWLAKHTIIFPENAQDADTDAKEHLNSSDERELAIAKAWLELRPDFRGAPEHFSKSQLPLVDSCAEDFMRMSLQMDPQTGIRMLCILSFVPRMKSPALKEIEKALPKIKFDPIFVKSLSTFGSSAAILLSNWIVKNPPEPPDKDFFITPDYDVYLFASIWLSHQGKDGARIATEWSASPNEYIRYLGFLICILQDANDATALKFIEEVLKKENLGNLSMLVDASLPILAARIPTLGTLFDRLERISSFEETTNGAIDALNYLIDGPRFHQLLKTCIDKFPKERDNAIIIVRAAMRTTPDILSNIRPKAQKDTSWLLISLIGDELLKTPNHPWASSPQLLRLIQQNIEAPNAFWGVIKLLTVCNGDVKEIAPKFVHATIEHSFEIEVGQLKACVSKLQIDQNTVLKLATSQLRNERMAALHLISSTPINVESKQVLIGLINDTDNEIALNALRAFAITDPSDAEICSVCAPAIKAIRTRKIALSVCKELGKRARPLISDLCKILGEPLIAPAERIDAMFVLEQIEADTPEYLQTLTLVLREPAHFIEEVAKKPTITVPIAKIVTRLGAKAAILLPVLKDNLNNPLAPVRSEVAEAIGSLGTEGLDLLPQLIEMGWEEDASEDGLHKARVLGAVGSIKWSAVSSNNALKLLNAYLKDDNTRVRLAAVRGLLNNIQFVNETSLPGLIHACGDGSEVIRTIAWTCLRTLKGHSLANEAGQTKRLKIDEITKALLQLSQPEVQNPVSPVRTDQTKNLQIFELKDGTSISGKLIKTTDAFLVIEKEDGTQRMVNLVAIAKVADSTKHEDDLTEYNSLWKRKHYPEAIDCLITKAAQGSPKALLELGIHYEHGTGLPQIKSKSVDCYAKADIAGSLDARVWHGDMYIWGSGVAKNPLKGSQLIQSAAAAGHTAGLRRMADLYLSGIGVEKDLAKAFNLYMEAGEKGAVEAYLAIADNEEFLLPKRQLAALRAIQAGKPEALSRFARTAKKQTDFELYFNLCDKISNEQSANGWFRVLMTKQLFLSNRIWERVKTEYGIAKPWEEVISSITRCTARLLESPRAIEKVLSKFPDATDDIIGTCFSIIQKSQTNEAIVWQLIPAMRKSPKSAAAAAAMLYLGDRVPQDKEGAKNILSRMGYDLKDLDSLGELFRATRQKTGDRARMITAIKNMEGNLIAANYISVLVHPDELQPKSMLLSIIKSGYESKSIHKTGLAPFHTENPEVVLDHAIFMDVSAVEKYFNNSESIILTATQNLVKAGSVDAEEHMGFLYLYGRGVQKDYTQSLHWFKMAADRGYANAMFYTGCMYLNGLGTERSSTLAANYFKKCMEVDSFHMRAKIAYGELLITGDGVQKNVPEARRLLKSCLPHCELNGYDAEVKKVQTLLNENQ